MLEKCRFQDSPSTAWTTVNCREPTVSAPGPHPHPRLEHTASREGLVRPQRCRPGPLDAGAAS